MSTVVAIQRQYDEVIAHNYDLDPLSLTNDSLDHAIEQLAAEGCLAAGLPAMRSLDLGMGTGLFYEKLRRVSARELVPFGLDLSGRMVDIARGRVPDLTAAVDDAANVDQHFCGEVFDLICTHFITGFVPLSHLAPRVFQKLKPGGYLTLLGATGEAFPALRRKASGKILQLVFRGRKPDLANLITPANAGEVADQLLRNGFEIIRLELLEPELRFANFDDFMEFAYHGGWLTPFIEDIGLHQARPALRKLLNSFVFPVRDQHRIVSALVRRPVDSEFDG